MTGQESLRVVDQHLTSKLEGAGLPLTIFLLTIGMIS